VKDLWRNINVTPEKDSEGYELSIRADKVIRRIRKDS